MYLTKIAKTITWINDHWAFLGMCLTVIAMIFAWIFYDVSLVQPLREISEKQIAYREKKNKRDARKLMVQRNLELAGHFLDNERYKEAEREYKRILQLDKHNPRAQIGLYVTDLYELMGKNDYSPAVMRSQLEFILHEDPNNPHALTLMGNLYATLSHYDEAIKYYNEATELSPHTASAWFGLGVVYQLQGEADPALKNYIKAVEKSDKWNERFLNNLASAYFYKGDYKNAIENYELLLSLDDSLMAAYLDVSLAYRLNGMLQEAGTRQLELLGLMDNKEIVKLDKNRQAWLFPLENEEFIALHRDDEKKFYALYTMSITYFLLDMKQESAKSASQAQAMEFLSKAGILDLVKRDLNRLASERAEYRKKIKEYVGSYLSRK